MVDGLVILAVGMAVVFLFLILLMGVIRLVGLRDDAPPAARRVRLLSAVDPERAARLAAAAAVSVELLRVGAPRPRPLPEAPDDPSAWRRRGRLGLQRGPETVAHIRAGRQGIG